jgi:hypothetical protein
MLSIANLALAGHQITDIFAFGADGTPLSNVQLFDQDGRPITVLAPKGQRDSTVCLTGQNPQTQECNSLIAPRVLVTGQQAFNVFPLLFGEAVPNDDVDDGSLHLDPSGTPAAGSPPLLAVPRCKPYPSRLRCPDRRPRPTRAWPNRGRYPSALVGAR